MDLKFRKLKDNEVEVRIGSAKDLAEGISLLLYKDARCDMNILDETVGKLNWQRAHIRDNANCIVSIWDEDKKQWISKEDTGVESFTGKEKGLASDSFKRACFNWGIGRELYTSPFIWLKAGLFKNKYDKFKVTKIGCDDDGIINKLEIYNKSLKKTVYKMGEFIKPKEIAPYLIDKAEEGGVDYKKLATYLKKNTGELTEEDVDKAVKQKKETKNVKV